MALNFVNGLPVVVCQWLRSVNLIGALEVSDVFIDDHFING